MNDPMLDAWDTHHRIVLFLLDAIDPDGLQSHPASGRGPAQMLAHLHNSRLAWLEASAPDLMAGLEKIRARTKADRDAITKERVHAALEQSGQAMATLFQRGVETGKIKNTRQPVIGFYSYVLAHEWYHLGELCLLLGQTDYALPKDIVDGIWSWSKR